MIELEENKQRFQVLLEAVPDLFFIIDSDGNYVDFVFKATETLKIKPEDIIGNSIFEVGFSEKMSGKIFQCIRIRALGLMKRTRSVFLKGSINSITAPHVTMMEQDLVDSTLGEGSAFSFSLPYEREESPLKIVR